MKPTSTLRSSRPPAPGRSRRDSTGLADPTDNEKGLAEACRHYLGSRC